MASHARTASFFSRKQPSNHEPTRPSTLGPGHPPSHSRQMSNTDDFGAKPQQPPQTQGQPNGPIPVANLHPEIRSAVGLTVAHAHKVYFSGPLVRRIERGTDGQKVAKDNGEWTDVWAQLGGTTLSVWNTKEIEEASKEGKEVPPTYINMTDAFIQVLGSVTIPGTADSPPKRYMNVITLNTAGSNLLLFSCPTTAALMSWAAALRLAAWEKSRLEEIYTAHLIRITHDGGRDVRSPLIRGRMEGWVRIRVAGQTDWKRMWMVVIAGDGSNDPARANSPAGAPRKNRMSTLFSRNESPAPSVNGGASSKPIIAMYSSPKLKDRKKALLTLQDVSQAFAVYPERAELISKSTLIKVEGSIGNEETAGGMKGREGWVLIMPELENGLNQANEMLKWVLGLHDACELYGRPKAYSWDPRDRTSLMFAYPVGPHKDLLFLDRELAETLDPREDRNSAIRSRLLNILVDRMAQVPPPGDQTRRSNDAPHRSDAPPMLPPIGEQSPPLASPQQQSPPPALPLSSPTMHPPQMQSGDPSQGPLPQLPSFSFGAESPGGPFTVDRAMSPPVNERSPPPISNSPRADEARLQQNARVNEWQEGYKHASGTEPMLDRPMNSSPRPLSPTLPSYGPLNPMGQQDNMVAPLHPHRQGSLGYQGIIPHPPTPYMDQSFRQSSDPTFRQNSEYSLTRPSQEPAFNVLYGRRSSEQEPVEAPSSTEDDEPSFVPPRMRSPGSLSSLSSPSAQLVPLPPSRIMSPAATTTPSPRSHSPRPPSTMSALTSPFSMVDQEANTSYSSTTSYGQDAAYGGMSSVPPSPNPPSNASTKTPSVYPSPYSPLHTPVNAAESEYTSEATSPRQRALSPPSEESHNFSGEAGALYFIQAMNPSPENARSRRPPVISEDEEESESDISKPPSPAIPRPEPRRKTSADQPARRAGTPMAFVTRDQSPPARGPGLGRKPSGARVPASSASSRHERSVPTDSLSSTERDSDTANMDPSSKSVTSVDDNADALAAFSFLDSEEKPRAAPAPPHLVEPERDQPSPQESVDAAPYRSSFAPSKQAAERKARSQAQQASSHAASLKPGRTKSRRKPKKTQTGGWNESSDEEEEEEDDDEADSDEEPVRRGSSPSTPSTRDPGGVSPGQGPEPGLYPQPRQPRNLPQPPPRDSEYLAAPNQRRIPSDAQSQFDRRTYFEDGTQYRQQSEVPTPGAARQNVWSQALDPGRNNSQPEYSNGRDTFVQIEPRAEAMTKAFTPQGLLSAGLQDKHDRSAKRQEEVARETGGSLINVPHKPPPPQMGLLGAITAHERERKREGGVGAALTEREREKRVAEDRQRKVDDLQRQQLEMAQQGGSMYGSQFGGGMGMNPMMNPMMPMMTGMGYPGMQQGYNPMMQQQQMFAAQQAAAYAYQQAMYQFSIAGSQVGGEGGQPQQTGMQPGVQPNITGMQPMQPNMSGNLDPRMSMYSMGGMGMPMGSSMGMGMGGYPGQPSPYGMAPQFTGMSNFNPQFPPTNEQAQVQSQSPLPPPQIPGQPERRDSPQP